MMKHRVHLPLTTEDAEIWARLSLRDDNLWVKLRTGSRVADRLDAELMLEIGWRVPGCAVVYVDIGGGQTRAHSIAGRKRREEFDRWLATEADEETRQVVLAARRRRLT